MKKTPLYDEHVRLGAQMVELGGWQMPVFYTNVIDEHLNTRAKVTLFDICHMGEIKVSGPDAISFLQYTLSNDISRIESRKMQYNVMCSEKGGIIDDLMVYNLTKDDFLLVVNASNIEKDYNWLISKKQNFNVQITNMSDQTAKLDVQGPNSPKLIEKLTLISPDALEMLSYKEFIINGVNVLISRSGYTGEDGFELYFARDKAPEMWRLLLTRGKSFGIKPAGLGARDSLRIEACYSLYGHEINEDTNPIEAGIGFAVSFDKEFIGKQSLINSKQKQTRKIVAFEMLDRGIPRQNYSIKKDGNLLGYVTSGTMSPIFKKGIGMGFVKIDQAQVGSEIEIEISGKLYTAKIVNRPIYAYKGGKK